MNVWLALATNGFFLISEEDRNLLVYDWSVVTTSGSKCYVRAQVNGQNVYLHRLIMGAAKGQEVDHINGDGLDNSRANLRLANRSQNCANRRDYRSKSGFRGVYAQPNGKTWQVRISVNNKLVGGGSFSDPEEAARHYLARQYYGEFATLNFQMETI